VALSAAKSGMGSRAANLRGVSLPAFFELASNSLVVIFVVSSMALMGLSSELQEIVAPLRKPRFVLATLVGNFAVVPLFAYLLTVAIPLDKADATGLLLLGTASGAPFLPKLVELAKGDVALSVGLMLLQTVSTIAFLPIALPWLIPGLEADAWAIAKPLLGLMLLPLAVCLLIQKYVAALARLLKPVLAIISNLALILATLMLLGLNARSFLETFGSGAALTGAVFVLLACLVGYGLGQLQTGTTVVQTFGTGQRNIAAALVVATSNSLAPTVVVMLLLTTFVGLTVLLVAAMRFRRKAALSTIRG